MNLFRNVNKFSVDLKMLTIADIVSFMYAQNEIREDGMFYVVEKIDDNTFIFGMPRSKYVPEVFLHTKYLPDINEIIIESRYKNYKFSAVIYYVFPLMLIYLGFLNSEGILWKEVGILTLILTINNYFIIRGGISSKWTIIERELVIRAKYLLRQKGYKGVL